MGHLNELMHADEQGRRGALADKGPAQDRAKTPGQIAVGRQPGARALDLDKALHLHAPEARLEIAPQPLTADVLKSRLQSQDVVLNMLDGEYMAIWVVEPTIKGKLALLDEHVREGSNQRYGGCSRCSRAQHGARRVC